MAQGKPKSRKKQATSRRKSRPPHNLSAAQASPEKLASRRRFQDAGIEDRMYAPELQKAAEAFLVEHWRDVAITACLGFHADGRGAVLCYPGSAELKYVKASTVETRTYDPETDVVLIHGDALICGHAVGELAPPEVINKIVQDAVSTDPVRVGRLVALDPGFLCSLPPSARKAFHEAMVVKLPARLRN